MIEDTTTLNTNGDIQIIVIGFDAGRQAAAGIQAAVMSPGNHALERESIAARGVQRVAKDGIPCRPLTFLFGPQVKRGDILRGIGRARRVLMSEYNVTTET